MAFTMKVEAQTMKAGAARISESVRELEKQWKKFADTVERSKSYWTGEASREHQEYYLEVKDDVEKIIRMLKEHPNDLLKMAGIYEEAENAVINLEKALPDDAIF